MQDTCPSWLYPVTKGATSIWERWDALREDGTINVDPVGKTNMVSFSHYAYGAIGLFLYERIGGLTANEPGYRRFTVAPHVGGGLCRDDDERAISAAKKDAEVDWTIMACLRFL